MSDRNLRHKTVPVYDDDEEVQDEIDGKRTFDIQEKLDSTKYNADFLVDLEGHEMTFERIQSVGLNDPIRIKEKDGLGMVMPDGNTFSVSDVRAFVGGRRTVDVMECKTQRALEMSMRDFEHYFQGKDRKHIYNVISLEFSQSRLETLVRRPTVVDKLDWIDLVWPQHLKHIQTDQTNKLHSMKYPKVQKYCLMSVAGCYTDFHIDFGGTSVWYHILKGGKIFWLIPPTNENLRLYERWTMSGNQGDIFFGDMVTKCQRVELHAGNSLMIPSGWIHAVHTPLDSIVFGGNFLNSFTIPMQLRISQLEERLKVPNRFRFPFFSEVLWYALDRYIHTLSNKSFLNEEFKEKNLLEEKKHEVVLESNKENEIVTEYTHLTPFEYKGLQKLIESLECLPKGSRCIPEGIEFPDKLLEAGKELLTQHSGDDYQLAITGRPKAYWPNPLKSGVIPSKTVKKPKLQKLPSHSAVKKQNTGRVRRVRCKECEACLRSDCMECVFCKDMRKHGGPGTMKQTCIKRRCLNPLLPSTVREEPSKEPASKPPDTVTSSKPGRKGKRVSESIEDETPEKIVKLEPEELAEDNTFDDSNSPSHSSLPSVVISRVSAGDLMKYAVRPASVYVSDCCKISNEKVEHNKAAWMQVFKRMNHADLSVCMCVCKHFLRWCSSPDLWERVDLTGKHFNASTLRGLVRRSPVSINLSRTNISYKQLLWLLERSPMLRELHLIRCSWSCVAALCSAACPPLQCLDLAWVCGFTNTHLKQLLSTPTDSRPGQEVPHTRLRFCRDLSLTGTDITDSSLKFLINHLPHLNVINISFCTITSDGIGHLVNPKSPPSPLSRIIAQHCHLVNDVALTHVAKLQTITEIDFRGCLEVTNDACSALVSKFGEHLQLKEPLYIVSIKT